MAYVTGSAASFADLKTAIENACVANSWVLSSGVLSKDGCYVQLTATAGELVLKGANGQSGSTLTDVPNATYKQVQLVSPTADPISFPINYEVHLFAAPNEVYCVVNYNSNFYQQLSFGQSDVAGIGGSGNWFTGAFPGNATAANTPGQQCYSSVVETTWGTVSFTVANAWGLFTDTGPSFVSSFIHCGLDSVEWLDTISPTTSTGARQGPDYCASLINSLPNAANQSTVLVPIKCIKPRTSGGRTIVANLNNARYTRIDNLVPGEIITFGSDQWKIYPMLRKDSAVRNGVPWATGATHSGTLGYAIRYTGT